MIARNLTALTFAALTLTACGIDDDGGTDGTADAGAGTTQTGCGGLAGVLGGNCKPGQTGGTGANANANANANAGDACAQACQSLTSCGFCLMSDEGCIDTATCTSVCRQTAGGAEAAQCVLAAGCDANAINTCVGGGGRGGGSTTGGNTGGSQCDGCVWDGSACTWYSQSNWGAGPFSGAASECDPACCR
jgi:hypothetical protein